MVHTSLFFSTKIMMNIFTILYYLYDFRITHSTLCYFISEGIEKYLNSLNYLNKIILVLKM